MGMAPPYSGIKSQKNSNHDGLRIVPVQQQDMEVHYSTRDTNITPALDVVMEFNPDVMDLSEEQLLSHFQQSASRALPIFGHDPTELGNTLIRIALSENTPSAGAVHKAILAFSSLHAHGVHSQAMELKISALRALAAMPRPKDANISCICAAQHIAAGMLLCCFEIHLSSCSSADWRRYFHGVKEVVRTARLEEVPEPDRSPGLIVMLDWVRYHDVHMRFIQLHWHREPPLEFSMSSHIGAIQKQDPSMETILTDLLDQVIMSVPTLAKFQSVADISDEEQRNVQQTLDVRLRSLKISNTMHTEATVLELYRLSILIYLNRIRTQRSLSTRAATETNQQSRAEIKSQLQNHIDQAFFLLPKLKICTQQFPIFILGCEAYSDDQRARVLDLLNRTEKISDTRSLAQACMLLEAMWARDDLSVLDRGAKDSYSQRFSSVVSRARVAPTFV
ncbi:hypothetical protein OQA88_7216 [Cercophora sp. LCS_1]